ncbi:hypothetical protein MTO96_024503 [Rhipicephalus appendiculatus]
MPLAVGSVPSRALRDDSHHDLQRRQRLGSFSLVCTVSGSDTEQTTSTMLSDAEETLTATDKAGAIGSSTDPNAVSLPVTEHKNDPQLGEGMDEDSNASTIVTDKAEEDVYDGACWKVVRTKRRARNAAALEAASPLTTDLENPLTKPRPSVAKRLPPLPFRDEKVILRPLGGLRLDQWPRPTLATALWAAAGVSPHDRRNLILRTRPEQNLAVISTPSSHVADALLKVQELLLGQRTYPVSAYLAAPDDSCKGIVPGLKPGTPSHTLVEEMQATDIQILQARMMGQTNIALVTFDGLRVPRFVRFLGAELRCYPHRPRQQVCKTCLKLGHRADHCPTPDVKVLPATPATAFNRSWVKKAIDEQQRQMTESTNAAPPSATTDASVTPLKKSGRSRSKKRSTSRSKARTKSKSRSRSRSQSTSARIQEKRPTIPASQASALPYKKALLGKPATSTAATDHQQPQSSENNNAKAAPREVSWGQGPAQLNLPQTSPHNTSRPSPPPECSFRSFPRNHEATP